MLTRTRVTTHLVASASSLPAASILDARDAVTDATDTVLRKAHLKPERKTALQRTRDNLDLAVRVSGCVAAAGRLPVTSHADACHGPCRRTACW